MRGGLSVGFCNNPPVEAWSVIPAPRRIKWACCAELASALKAAAGSDICCKSCGSNPSLLSCSSPMEWVGTANCGGVKSLNVSSPSPGCLGLEVRWLKLQQGGLWCERQSGRHVLGSKRELAVWLGSHRRLGAACTWRGLGPLGWSLGWAGWLWPSWTLGLRWVVDVLVWPRRH